MRAGGYVGACFAVGICMISGSQWALGAPGRAMLPSFSKLGKFQLVEDTCWWWGFRWQYGWRGYGWYPCWDWAKPLPTVVAPEETPPEAVSPPALPESCVKRWRDDAGNWRARRVC